MGSISFYSPYLTEDPISTEITHSLVIDRFANAQDYADRSFQTALNYLGDLEGFDVDFDWTPPGQISVGYPSGLAGLNPSSPAVPAINPIEVAPADFPYQAPTLGDYSINPIVVPEPTYTLPNFYIPEPPSREIPSLTASPPPEQDVTLPSPGEIPALPPLPVLTEILPPDEPTLEVPQFTATLPIMDLTPPEFTYAWNEAEYNSELYDALKNKLIDGILNGGTGLAPEVEQAMYDRAASRLDVELQKAELVSYNDFASRGSRLPGGALIARLQETQLQNSLAREDLTRDILYKNADLAYQYSTFVIEQGIELEKATMDLFNNVQQRAFEASRTLVEFLIQEYEVRVRAYAARLEAYRTEVEVYKARIEVEIAKVEIYKATIEGRKLSLEMQSLMVDLYTRQVQAIEIMARIYGIKMEGARVEAEIYNTKIEQFKALIEAYKAQVEGVTAEYELYTAQIVGESEKAKMYQYQVQGYEALVEAYKTRSEVEINNLQAVVEKNKAELGIFSAQLDKYRTEIQANVSEAEIQAQAEGLKLQVFDGQIRKFTSEVQALVDSYQAQANIGIANADIQVRYGEMLARLEAAQAEIQAELIRAKGLIASQLASAALSSVSAGANLGYSQSRSDSKGWSKSDTNSYSFVQSHSEAHSDSNQTIDYTNHCCD